MCEPFRRASSIDQLYFTLDAVYSWKHQRKLQVLFTDLNIYSPHNDQCDIFTSNLFSDHETKGKNLIPVQTLISLQPSTHHPPTYQSIQIPGKTLPPHKPPYLRFEFVNDILPADTGPVFDTKSAGDMRARECGFEESCAGGAEDECEDCGLEGLGAEERRMRMGEWKRKWSSSFWWSANGGGLGVIHVDSSRREASCAFLKEEDQIRSLPFLFLPLSRFSFFFPYPVLRVIILMGPGMHDWVVVPTITEPSFIVLAENESLQDLADSLE